MTIQPGSEMSVFLYEECIIVSSVTYLLILINLIFFKLLDVGLMI